MSAIEANPVLFNTAASLAIAANGTAVLTTGNDANGPGADFIFTPAGSFGDSGTPVNSIFATSAKVSSAPVAPDDVVNKAALTAALLATGGGVSVPFIAPSAMLSGWYNVTDNLYPQSPAGFRKVGNTVELRGLVTGGAIGTNIFVLPLGYRPPVQKHFVVNVGDYPAAGILKVQPNGAVYLRAATAAAYTSLETVSFTLDV